MKIGGMEGTPQEIRDTFENHGLRLEDYLEKPAEPLPNRWLIVPSVGVGVVLLLLVLLAPLTRTWLLLLFLLGAGFLIWVAVSVQVRFKIGWATGVVAIGILLMLLVASGFIEPKESAEFLKEMRK